MTITDFRFYFFSQTSFVTSFEKSFSVFFCLLFKALFESPSGQNKDITISHEGPEQKYKGKCTEHIYGQNRLKKRRSRTSCIFDVSGTKKPWRGEKTGA